MQIELTSFVLGALVGVLVAVAFAIPRVGRVLSCMSAVVLMIGGVGFLTWAIAAIFSNEELRPISWEQLYVASPAEAFGLGGGLLAGGILSLVLSTRGSRRRQSTSATVSNPPLRY